jgi:serine phosphatase RsbU (regulator of sigma subunit)
MSEEAEGALSRLWRDRAQIREQERNEAHARARIADEKVAILTAENERLADENTRLRAQLTPAGRDARAEINEQMEALQKALLPLIEPAMTH